MTKKEQQAEEQELTKAQRKAHRYKLEFLHRVRDMIDREIEDNEYVQEHSANHIGNEVADQIK